MNERTTEDRLKEVITLIKKLKEVGFSTTSSGLVEFIKRSNKFVKDGIRWDGKIKFVEYLNITLVVTLCSKKTVECSVTIKQH